MKAELKSLFTAKDLQPFMRQRNLINVITLTGLFAFSGAVIYCYHLFPHPIYIAFFYLVMGAVQHTIATFVHEAAHLGLFSNRKANDFFGHFLCAAPLISYMKDYRYFHFEHHRHTGNIEKDPELKFYRAMGVKPVYESKAEVLKTFINDFTGITYLRGLVYVLKFFGEKRKQGMIEKPTFIENLCVLFWIAVVPVVMWKLGYFLPYVLFWLLPIFTLTPVLLRWHSFGEHIREKNSCASENTLTHRMGLVPTLFLYPIHSSFHLEHHLYPQIPWYSLKKFYLWAMQNPTYAEKSRKLTVDGFFIGKETVLKVAFPVKK